MYKYEIVREGLFPGTIEDFRALMHERYQLQPDFKPDQIFLQGERTPSDYPQNRARWEITRGASLEQRGYIIARQLPDGTTKLQFAYYSKFKPIGPLFDVEYADSVLQPASHTFTDNKSMAYNLTSKQEDALRSLVHLGRSWREEFYIIWHDPDEISDILIIWHDPDEISDILDYDYDPPQISRGDIQALEKEGLLICDFFNNSKVRVTLTAKAYEAVRSNFKSLDASGSIISILFLVADPTDQTRLRLGEES